MLTGEIRKQVDKIWDAFWYRKVQNYVMSSKTGAVVYTPPPPGTCPR